VAREIATRPRETSLFTRVVLDPIWIATVEQRLEKLASYRVGWDGYNSKPPRENVIEFVKSMLHSVMKPTTPAPSIVPISGGGLQIEWHTNGLDIEVAVFAPFAMELTAVFPDGRPAIEDEALSEDLEGLGTILTELA
jgi:hypothetical protein